MHFISHWDSMHESDMWFHNAVGCRTNEPKKPILYLVKNGPYLGHITVPVPVNDANRIVILAPVPIVCATNSRGMYVCSSNVSFNAVKTLTLKWDADNQWNDMQRFD